MILLFRKLLSKKWPLTEKIDWKPKKKIMINFPIFQQVPYFEIFLFKGKVKWFNKSKKKQLI